MKKFNQLKQYSLTLFTNFNTSKFIYSKPNDILFIKKIRLHINSSKPNRSHFLYLYFLSQKQLPYLHNFYTPKKFRHQKHRIRRRHGISKFLKKKYNFIVNLLTEIIPYSSPTEKEAIKKIKDFWKLTIWQAPLTSETYRLQSLNNYISLLPVTISFHFTSVKTFEQLYFFNFFKLLHQDSIPQLLQ